MWTPLKQVTMEAFDRYSVTAQAVSPTEREDSYIHPHSLSPGTSWFASEQHGAQSVEQDLPSHSNTPEHSFDNSLAILAFGDNVPTSPAALEVSALLNQTPSRDPDVAPVTALSQLSASLGNNSPEQYP